MQSLQTCFTIGNEKLVSGTSLNVRASSYGLSLSHSQLHQLLPLTITYHFKVHVHDISTLLF